jgi:hypothetical protein
MRLSSLGVSGTDWILSNATYSNRSHGLDLPYYGILFPIAAKRTR